MLRWFGAFLVFLGCALLALDGLWDVEIASFPVAGDHGLHALEGVGFAVAAVGVAVLWTAARRR